MEGSIDCIVLLRRVYSNLPYFPLSSFECVAVVSGLFSLHSGMSLLNVSIIDLNHVYGLFSPPPVMSVYVWNKS